MLSPPLRSQIKEDKRMIYSVRETNGLTSPMSHAASHKKISFPTGLRNNCLENAFAQNF